MSLGGVNKDEVLRRAWARPDLVWRVASAQILKRALDPGRERDGTGSAVFVLSLRIGFWHHSAVTMHKPIPTLQF